MLYINLQLLISNPEDLYDVIQLLISKVREKGDTPSAYVMQNGITGEKACVFVDEVTADLELNPVPQLSKVEDEEPKREISRDDKYLLN